MSKDLSYTRIFPRREEISHETAFKERLKSHLVTIIREERSISEKDFKRYRVAMDLVDSTMNDEIIKFANSEYNSGKRIEYVSEIVYDKYFKDIKIDESIKKFSNF